MRLRNLIAVLAIPAALAGCVAPGPGYYGRPAPYGGPAYGGYYGAPAYGYRAPAYAGYAPRPAYGYGGGYGGGYRGGYAGGGGYRPQGPVSRGSGSPQLDRAIRSLNPQQQR